MLNSNAFDYVNLLDKAADASWKRENAITHNLANVDTPNYKRQDVEFEEILKRELRATSSNNAIDAVKEMNINKLEPLVYKDHEGFSYRLDGNNVDVDTENVELASEQIRYQAITEGISQEFSRFKSVIK